MAKMKLKGKARAEGQRAAKVEHKAKVEAAKEKMMATAPVAEPTEEKQDGTEADVAQDDAVQSEAAPEQAASQAADTEPPEAVTENTEEDKVPNSVVKEKFKKKYIENASSQGVSRKAAKRSNWDWLSQEIASECLVDKDKISIEAFKDLLDRNGVDFSKWTNRNKGWEGRFRMTGRVALQRVVAEKGRLFKAMSESVPPADWLAKYKKTEAAA